MGERARHSTARLHKALGSPRRLRLLEIVRAADEPLDARALARRIGVHPSTARAHLDLLVEAGLVGRSTQASGARGRPRVVYTAAPERDDGYRLLAAILSEELSLLADDPARRAAEAAERWGAELVEGEGPGGVTAARQRLVRLFAELGFAPELDDSGLRVLLRRCPFRQAALAHPEVVCGVHLGLLRGALARLGADLSATKLEPFVEPDLCVAHLAATG